MSTSSHGDNLGFYDPYEDDQNFLEYTAQTENAVPRIHEISA